ncbi:MAG: SAM-dependent methyltransferase [Lachnospiraceae bacterium]|nr:SAM-dependent methyltransferase [Lachnospiraceae bacterium]
MTELLSCFQTITADAVRKLTISKPRTKSEAYKKIVIEQKRDYYQISKYTEKQVFHENVASDELATRCTELTAGHYGQVNAWTAELEYILLISKKGSCSLKKNRLTPTNKVTIDTDHNRKKSYLLPEGTVIPPLVDMGVFTKEGHIVRSMYDKFKQINRFIEIIDDSVKEFSTDTLNVIDFGCGKSYLTFILYYYLTEIRHLKVHMIGLDLKADVIRKCNETAQKYGYDGLRFEMGDINGFTTPFEVNMVITLHACDTATDYALYNAIQWKADMIFSVPCCQHELNKQMQPENLSILGNYGILQERFAALATDAIRGNLLEYSGYKTQLLEFIDFAHTPKNILIRATRRKSIPAKVHGQALAEVEALMKEFHFEPTLYQLLKKRD